LLAVGILLLALGGLYLLVVAPVLDLYDQQGATLADRRMLATRLDAVAERLPAFGAEATALRDAANTRRITLEGATDAVAAAKMQSRIKELAASAGVMIGSAESIAAQDRDGYSRIGLRIVASGEYDALVRLFAAIEVGSPPLVIANLHLLGLVQPLEQQSSTRLDANFEVYGFRSIDAMLGQKQ
jgi:general secretion pathway protein M